MIQIYTPSDSEELVSRISKSNINDCIVNNLASFQVNGQYILHHRPRKLDKEIKSILIEAIAHGGKVMPLVDYLDQINGYTEIELLNSDYFIQKTDFSVLRSRRKVKIKCLMDKVFAVFLLLLTSPIMLLTSLLIKFESKGPVFYKQERVGQFNKPFMVYKFRSMRQDAEKNGAQWSTEGDNRITRVGYFIRKLRIDELPQLINVLRGEMSIVGPRPEREVFIKDLEKVIPYYRFRHAVLPGVTGWAQVKYPYGASVEDSKWKHKYDLYYIKHGGLRMDLKIMLYTVKVVLLGKGR
jgi:exopolysaccharide biosynthesis polyprenyl glycosylphosphotransferase